MKRMNAEISETMRAMLLGFGMQIHELLAQRKFVSAGPRPLERPQTAQNCPKVCYAHFNDHKPPTNLKKKS